VDLSQLNALKRKIILLFHEDLQKRFHYDDELDIKKKTRESVPM
jgi:hypothetical protein